MNFDFTQIDNDIAYQSWRENKLRAYENAGNTTIIDIDGSQATAEELTQLQTSCRHFNYTIYRLATPESGTKSFVQNIGERLSLHRLDGNLCSDEDKITAIQVMPRGRQAIYIPYTDKKLTWHTDGYYNKEENRIRAMILHCVRPAISGGENLMLDHEMAYIQLRDEDPLYIQAFLQADALTIPPNIENGVEIRGAQGGPVFSMDSHSSSLHMRFSARSRNIQWKDNAQTQEAVACMNSLLSSNNPYVINYRMQAGEGIIANNVLHNRTAFTDSEDQSETRLLYRARYYDRVK